MARYEHLPIYKTAMDLAAYLASARTAMYVEARAFSGYGFGYGSSCTMRGKFLEAGFIDGGSQVGRAQMRIAHGHGNRGMAHQLLNRSDIHPGHDRT